MVLEESDIYSIKDEDGRTLESLIGELSEIRLDLLVDLVNKMNGLKRDMKAIQVLK